MAYTPLGTWILVSAPEAVGESYVAATVTAAGPDARVSVGQQLLLEAAGMRLSVPVTAFPASAIIARDLEGSWHPDPGWATVAVGTGEAWFVQSSRRFDIGVQVLIAEGAAVQLEGGIYIVPESEIVALVT